MADSSERQSEKHISKGQLSTLIKFEGQINTRIAEERGALGAKIKKAVDENHLVKPAYDFVKRLVKMDPAKAATVIRATMLYIDHLGLAAQTDIEDAIAESGGMPGAGASQPAGEGAEEGAGGETTGGAGETTQLQDEGQTDIREVLANGGTAALERLRLALQDADTVEAAQKGGESFTADFPLLKDHAATIVADRIAVLSAEGGAAQAGKTRRRRGAVAEPAVH